MKKNLSLILIIISFLSCKKDIDKNTTNITGNFQYLTSIKAGQTSGIGIKFIDIIPDDTLKTSPYLSEYSKEYDLNGDDTLDFKITHYRSTPFMLGGTYSSLQITALHNNKVCVLSSDTSLAEPILYDAIIDSSKVWSNTVTTLYSYAWSMSGTTTTSGYWQKNDKYFIGIRIKSGVRNFYSWIDVRCGDYTSFSSNIITRYAITTAY